MKKEIIKPFSLEAWKNGAKIKTRYGHEVRIICTDAKDENYPIIALAKLFNNDEVVAHYTSEGKVRLDTGVSDNDLVIVDEDEEFWSDKENKEAKGYFIGFESNIIFHTSTPYYHREHKYFASRKQAKSALAMAMISQIIANDIEHFGGAITDEEWKDLNVEKYVIHRLNNAISFMCSYIDYHFLAFHTEDQRDLFLEKYHDLVSEFLMIG